jgi:hypothetical protein
MPGFGPCSWSEATKKSPCLSALNSGLAKAKVGCFLPAIPHGCGIVIYRHLLPAVPIGEDRESKRY